MTSMGGTASRTPTTPESESGPGGLFQLTLGMGRGVRAGR